MAKELKCDRCGARFNESTLEDIHCCKDKDGNEYDIVTDAGQNTQQTPKKQPT